MHAPVFALATLVLLAAVPGCSLDAQGRAHDSTADSIASDGGDVSVSHDASAPADAQVPPGPVDAGELDGSAPGLPGEAGAGEIDAGGGDDAGAGPFDASGPSDAGDAGDAGEADAGVGEADAGVGDADAGVGEADAAVTHDAGNLGGDGGPDVPPRCPGREHVGDVEVRTAAELAELAGIVCIRGALTISRRSTDPGAPPSGPLPDLRFVFGDVTYDIFDGSEPPRAEHLERIDGTLSLGTSRPVQLPALTQAGGLTIAGAFGRPSAGIELPALRDVEGDISTQITHEVGTVRLPELVRVAGSLNLQGASALRELSVPKLRAVEGNLQVQRASVIEVLAFPALERAGSVLISGSGPSDALRTIDLSALVGVPDSLRVMSRTLEQISLSSLREVGGTLSFGFLDELTALELPALVSARTLLIYDASLLSTLALPSLATVSYGAIGQCPLLSECVVAALNAQLAPGSGTIRGWGLSSDPACPSRDHDAPPVTSESAQRP